MTIEPIRPIDTFMAVIGADSLPFVWPWWANVQPHNIPNSHPGCASDYVGWRVTLVEFDFRNSVVLESHLLDHHNVYAALLHIAANSVPGQTFTGSAVESAKAVLANGWESADFDVDTADVVVQVALLGEVRYS